jgi:hypothetical protein
MAKKDLEITKQSSFPRRDIDLANVSDNWSDLGDKTSGGEGPQRSRTTTERKGQGREQSERNEGNKKS